ncbi:hypothetical protein EMIT0P176_40027 [Pseudomonas sp. IT-P176]
MSVKALTSVAIHSPSKACNASPLTTTQPKMTWGSSKPTYPPPLIRRLIQILKPEYSLLSQAMGSSRSLWPTAV